MTRQQQINTGACWLLGILVLAWMIPPAGLAAKRSVQRWEAAGEGVNRALIIGINEYADPDIRDLATAVNDARAVADLLERRLGFDRSRIIDLYNDEATRSGITSAFQKLARVSGEKDRVLIYYAGHGDMYYGGKFSYEIRDPAERLRMKRLGIGYWVPQDGRRGKTGRYISNSEVRDALSQISAAHILLVADSCYSGGMTERGFGIEAPEMDVAESMALPSRLLLASGGLHPVDDGTPVKRCFGHSTFACYFLKALETAPGGYLTTRHLYSQLYVPVVSNSDQEPRLEKFLKMGHEGGQFVFVIEEEGETTLTVEANVSGAWVRLDGNEIGRTPLTDLPVEPGDYRLSVGKPGYRTYQHPRPITVEPGRRQSFGVTLLEDEPDDARLFVETEPRDAEIRVVGISEPFQQGMSLRPGQYKVEVSAPGCKTRTVSVTLSAGSDRHSHIPLECGPTPPGPGKLMVEIIPDIPDASVWINGAEFGNSREFTIRTAGEYRVRVTADGYQPFESRVSAGPGDRRTVTARLKKDDRDRFTNSIGMEFVRIPKGCFQMGQTASERERLIIELGEEKYKKFCADELPMHKVCLSRDFYMGTTEVTVGQWKAFVNATGYRTEAEEKGGAWILRDNNWKNERDGNWRNPYFNQTDRHPVTCVTWNDASAFIEWLSRKEERIYLLPTEAEWEYAARAGNDTPFTYGRCLTTDQANYDGRYPMEGCYSGEDRERTIPVGSLNAPNDWGLHDMHGNVWEWCADWYGEYPSSSVKDPTGPYSGKRRVRRGGGWDFYARFCRSATRGRSQPFFPLNAFGFRLVSPPGQ